MMEKYLTTFDVNEIMSNLDKLAAFECLGRMSQFINKYEQQMVYRDRWRGVNSD